jgi:hypothetical protein
MPVASTKRSGESIPFLPRYRQPLQGGNDVLEVILRKDGQELYGVKFATDEVTLIQLMKMLFDLEKHSGALVNVPTREVKSQDVVVKAPNPVVSRGTPFKPSPEVSKGRETKKARYEGKKWEPYDIKGKMRAILIALNSIGKPIDQARELDQYISNADFQVSEDQRGDKLRFYLRELVDRGLVIINEHGQREITEAGRNLALKISRSHQEKGGFFTPTSS